MTVFKDGAGCLFEVCVGLLYREGGGGHHTIDLRAEIVAWGERIIIYDDVRSAGSVEWGLHRGVAIDGGLCEMHTGQPDRYMCIRFING